MPSKKITTLEQKIQSENQQLVELKKQRQEAENNLKQIQAALKEAETSLWLINAQKNKSVSVISQLKEQINDESLTPVELQKKKDLERIRENKRHQDWLNAEDSREASYKSLAKY